jgi:hypothetical protein
MGDIGDGGDIELKGWFAIRDIGAPIRDIRGRIRDREGLAVFDGGILSPLSPLSPILTEGGR